MHANEWLGDGERHISHILEQMVANRFWPLTGDFVVGWVHARMEQLRKIIHRLGNVPDFSLRELGHLRNEILSIDAEVQLQEKMVKDDRIKPKMVEYRALLKRAVVTQERREQRARSIEQGDDRNPPIRFDDIGQEEAARASPSLSTLDIYASDNEELIGNLHAPANG